MRVDWRARRKGRGVPDGHAHRFRDTFAVGLLQAGVPTERVSVLLGHSSIKVTEKHYSPWVRARQEQLEADVRRTWESPAPETKGTPDVQEKRDAVQLSAPVPVVLEAALYASTAIRTSITRATNVPIPKRGKPATAGESPDTRVASITKM